MGNHEVEQIAHLMRRAGFGATRDQLEAFAAKGYEATVDQLLDQAEEQRMGDDAIPQTCLLYTAPSPRD